MCKRSSISTDERLDKKKFFDKTESGCGVVIGGVDRNKRITIIKIVVLFTTCTAMADEAVACWNLRPRAGEKLLYGGHKSTHRRCHQIILRCERFVLKKV